MGCYTYSYPFLAIPQCRRSNSLSVNLGATKEAVTDVVVEATGLKVYGEGEWKVHKHSAGKHRTWMKLHVAAITLTSNAVDDATEVKSLMSQISKPVTRL